MFYLVTYYEQTQSAGQPPTYCHRLVNNLHEAAAYLDRGSVAVYAVDDEHRVSVEEIREAVKEKKRQDEVAKAHAAYDAFATFFGNLSAGTRVSLLQAYCSSCGEVKTRCTC